MTMTCVCTLTTTVCRLDKREEPANRKRRTSKSWLWYLREYNNYTHVAKMSKARGLLAYNNLISEWETSITTLPHSYTRTCMWRALVLIAIFSYSMAHITENNDGEYDLQAMWANFMQL